MLGYGPSVVKGFWPRGVQAGAFVISNAAFRKSIAAFRTSFEAFLARNVALLASIGAFLVMFGRGVVGKRTVPREKLKRTAGEFNPVGVACL